MMRIIMATPDFPPWEGGVARVSGCLARGLHRLGAEVTVLCPRQSQDSEAHDRGLPFEVARISLPKAKALKPLFAWPRLLSLVGKVRPHLVFATTWHPFGLACALLPRGTPYAVQVHGTEVVSRKFESARWRWLMGHTFRRAYAAVAVSKYSRGLLARVGIPTDGVTVIENGVDPEPFIKERGHSLAEKYGVSGRPTIITVARLVKRKGLDSVIRALPLVARKVPDVTFLIGGKGPEESDLRSLAESCGVADRVRFAGFISDEDLGSFYALGDVFALLSREDAEKGEVEGFGIAFLEAAAAGLPAVGGASGGVPEAVVHGVTGLLVDPEDVEALAEALSGLLLDERLREEMGGSARVRVMESFTWEMVAARYLEFFRRRFGGETGV